MLRELMTKNRSYRRYHQETPVEKQTLRELIDLARLCPSAGNLQPLKYFLSCDEKTNAQVFPHLRWAAYLKEWGWPEGGRTSRGVHCHSR